MRRGRQVLLPAVQLRLNVLAGASQPRKEKTRGQPRRVLRRCTATEELWALFVPLLKYTMPFPNLSREIVLNLRPNYFAGMLSFLTYICLL